MDVAQHTKEVIETKVRTAACSDTCKPRAAVSLRGSVERSGKGMVAHASSSSLCQLSITGVYPAASCCPQKCCARQVCVMVCCMRAALELLVLWFGPPLQKDAHGPASHHEHAVPTWHQLVRFAFLDAPQFVCP